MILMLYHNNSDDIKSSILTTTTYKAIYVNRSGEYIGLNYKKIAQYNYLKTYSTFFCNFRIL